MLIGFFNKLRHVFCDADRLEIVLLVIVDLVSHNVEMSGICFLSLSLVGGYKWVHPRKHRPSGSDSLDVNSTDSEAFNTFYII